MARPTLLNPAVHGNLRLRKEPDFTAFSTMHLVPVVFHEFYGLATEFPLVFVRNTETGDFVPVAMMGLSKGVNLYCQTQDWPLAFIPTSFTLAPFSVHRLEGNKDEAVIGIDETSPLLGEVEGEALYNAAGEQTDYLKKRIDHVVNVTRQTLQTVTLCQWLAENNLFRTRPLAFQLGERAPRYEIEGVYAIDEEALEKAGDDTFLELRRRGLMPLIYAHLTSVHQFDRLLRRQSEADRTRDVTAG